MAIDITNVAGLPQEVRVLLDEARKVARCAYNVYSRFFVGAAAQCSTGFIYLGTFMENASYGLTVCAEQSAILAAVSSGDLRIRRMAIVGGRELDSPGPIITPCGRCRQVIWEASQVSAADVELYCANGDCSRVLLATSSELLPYAFGPDEVGMRERLEEYRSRFEGAGR